MNLVHSDRPLANCRLVATLPPKSFFGGNNLLKAIGHIEALKALGATVYSFDTEPVYAGDRSKIERQRNEIISFRPHAVIGTPHAGYVVQGGMIATPASPQGYRNIFFDDLELPAVLYWDHALTQPAHYLLGPLPAHPSESREGVLIALKRFFQRSNIVHFIPDTGHAQVLEEFGIGSFDKSAWYVQGVGKPFVVCGTKPERNEIYDENVAFFGNIYLAASRAIPYSDNSRIMKLRAKAQTACAADWGLSAFHSYSNAISDLDKDTRSSLRLDRDQSFYWRFMYDELSRFMNGIHRLNILQSCGQPIACFGNFNDPDSSSEMTGNAVVKSSLPYDGELATAFRRTRVVVDVVNAPFINGFSVKLMACFAAGGFILTNRKEDLIRALGPIANEIIYDDANDLAGKVDYFLSNERARLELIHQIGAIIRSKYTSESLFAVTVPAALDRLRVNPGRRC